MSTRGSARSTRRARRSQIGEMGGEVEDATLRADLVDDVLERKPPRDSLP